MECLGYIWTIDRHIFVIFEKFENLKIYYLGFFLINGIKIEKKNREIEKKKERMVA